MPFTNQTLNSATYTNQRNEGNDYLLKADGGFLLKADGGRILLAQSDSTEDYTNQTKNTASYNLQTKN